MQVMTRVHESHILEKTMHNFLVLACMSSIIVVSPHHKVGIPLTLKVMNTE
jgi:hypothetical protein